MCLSESNVIIKTLPLMNAMIELIAHSLVLSSSSSSSRRIQKWLGGSRNGLSQTVDLYYEYLSFVLEPSMMHPAHIVQQQIDDLM
jgi:hypothetical protein